MVAFIPYRPFMQANLQRMVVSKNPYPKGYFSPWSHLIAVANTKMEATGMVIIESIF